MDCRNQRIPTDFKCAVSIPVLSVNPGKPYKRHDGDISAHMSQKSQHQSTLESINYSEAFAAECTLRIADR